MKYSYIYLFLIVSAFATTLSFGQAITINAGNWNTAANWSTGTVPSATTQVTVNHAMNLSNISVQAKYIFNAASSGNATINMSSDSLIINADVSFNNTGNNLTGGVILVKSGATFTIGSFSTNGSFKLVIEPGATVVVNGSINNNGGTIQVDGTLTVSGSYSAANSSGNITGSGTFTTTGGMTSMNGGTIFGNPNQSCSSNCNGSNLCGTTVTITPNNTSVCEGATLSFSSSVSPTPTSYEWQSSATSSGFTAIATATNNNYSASVTSSAYYRLKVVSSGCATFSTPTSISVVALPSSPTAPGVSRCGDGTVTLTASGASAYNWYDDAIKTTLLISDDSYTTSSLSSDATYYVTAIDMVGCESAVLAVTATINSIPSPPTSTDVSNCGPGYITLTASNATGYRWYDDASKTTLLDSDNSYTSPELTDDTTYYVTAYDGNGCESVPFAVHAIINDLPDAPTVPDVSRCGTGTVTLNASGSTGVYNWYQDALKTYLLSEGTTSFTSPSLFSDGGYYVTAVDGDCESDYTLALVSIEECTGVSEFAILNGTKVYVSGKKLYIDASFSEKIDGLTIYNTQGKEMNNNQTLTNGLNIISLEHFQTGIYLVKIQAGENSLTRRVMVE